ncbi:MAG: MMPL family transporter [Chitinivibrionales bacterium]|nr:MMPL family transporter [Chitinivibrionales bacterium]
MKAAAVITVIPIAIFAALGWLDIAGQGLNQISLVGFVVALGLFVDNAIVVVENIGRYRRRGERPEVAAVKGTGQITRAIISSSATTILAFVPMILLETDAGKFVRSLPLTVVFSILASLAVSLTFTPFLTSRFMRCCG